MVDGLGGVEDGEFLEDFCEVGLDYLGRGFVGVINIIVFSIIMVIIVFMVIFVFMVVLVIILIIVILLNIAIMVTMLIRFIILIMLVTDDIMTPIMFIMVR